MGSIRRALLVALVMGAGAAAEPPQQASGDRKPAARPVPLRPLAVPQPPILIGVRQGAAVRPAVAVPGDSAAASTDALTFPTDRKASRSLSAAEDFIKEEAWGEAARVLQSLLDTPEDVFIEVPRDGATRWVSLRGEANRLMGTMPAKGREFYELQYGARAKARLAEAKAKNDPQALAEVAQRYRHTEAGAEATDLLGTYHLNRGRFVMASLCFERLLAGERGERVGAVSLLKAALAFRRTGDNAAFERVWKRLQTEAGGGVRLGAQTIALDDLRKEVEGPPAGDAVAGAFDWPMFRGNPGRSAEGQGGAPFLEATWSRPTMRQPQTEQWVRQAVRQQEERQQPVLSGYFPIAVTAQTKKGPVPLLVYRSFYGVHAVDLRDGRLFWESPAAGGLDKIVEYPEKAAQLGTWITYYLQLPGQPNLLLENSTVGTLSTDGTRVYAVDDLVLPPHPQSPVMQQLTWGTAANFGPLDDAVRHSRLQAFDLASGKFLWELGGSDAGDLGDVYFLGPPLPLGGKLYVLVEKASSLRLVCLDAHKGEVTWSQALANLRDRLLLEAGRRIRGVNLAYGDGILVCPTQAGAVIGVDVLSHSLAWEYSYREDVPPAEATPLPGRPVGRMFLHRISQQSLAAEWKATAPVVTEGKVVFTAPDGNSVVCLNLRDGSLAWKQPRADDLFLAGVFGGRVLLVGRTSCRALGLADGETLWRLDTGVPSGEGVASGTTYYLPLRSSAHSKEPEVCSIDIEHGTVFAHTKSRRNEVPGNLIFFGGEVLSQTPTAVCSYPQLPVRLAQINEALKRDPNDPVGLTDRGELKLDQGDLTGAVQDLKTALAHHPPPTVLPRTRGKYFETLTELFRRDFAASEPYLDEYRALCKVDIPADAVAEDRQRLEEEQQRRQANFLCLLAKGREAQGRLADALGAYLAFGALPGAKDKDRELVGVIDEPVVRSRPDSWAQGHIDAMLARASPEQRRALEQEVTRQWESAKSAKDLGPLRRLVSLFGPAWAAAAEARLELAERLGPDNFLEAELQLLDTLRQADRALRARAVEGLARLSLRKDLPDDAAYWYRELGRDYADVAVAAGKTGAEVLRDAAADPRLKPHLDEAPAAWAGRIKVREQASTFTPQQTVALEPEGRGLPFFQRHRLVLHAGTQLRLLDRATGEERWAQSLPTPGPAAAMIAQAAYPNYRVPYRVQGHLVILGLGPVVYALDPVDQKVLWQRNVYSGNLPFNYNVTPDLNRGGLALMMPDGSMLPLGQAGPVEASYVCLHTRDGLVALDPVRGTTRWSRTDASPWAEVFGDAEGLYWVEKRADGTVGAGHALRAADGVARDVPEFGPMYRRQAAVVGGRILLAERGGSILRLYNVGAGKDVWRHTFSRGAITVRGDGPTIVGVAEPKDGGRLRIFDLPTGRELMAARVDPKDLDRVYEAHLLADRDAFYVALQRPFDVQANQGPPSASVGYGIRCVGVNGKVYAFDRGTGRLRWKYDVANQYLVTNQFAESPVLVFTARYLRPFNAGPVINRGSQTTATKSIDKRTGKLLYDKEVQNPALQYFLAFTVNRAAGTVDLVSHTFKIQHYIVSEPGEGKP